METETENQRPSNGQLSLPHKDTIQLLEVYVKRSLSLNDSTLGQKKAKKREKWVTTEKKPRRSSSDPSISLGDVLNRRESTAISVVEPQIIQPERCLEESEKPTKKSKKTKKPSFWKNVLGFFSRKSNEDKNDEEERPSEATKTSEAVSTCLPVTPVSSQKKSLRRKSLRRRFSKKQLSFRLSKNGKDLNSTNVTGVEGKSGDLKLICDVLYCYRYPNQ